MQFTFLCYAVGIVTNIASIVALPIVGRSSFGFIHLYLPFKSRKTDFGLELVDLRSIVHLSKRGREGVSARSPEDVVPVEECRMALRATPIFDEALYRRCAGEGESEAENRDDSDSDEDSDDNDDGDAENIQLASNSPRQDCILTQMGLFPMPNFGLCESLSDTPPTPNTAPPVTPAPAPVTPQPVPASAPAPARKPVPVNANGPARAVPKRAFEAF